jgi:hypothetical protein
MFMLKGEDAHREDGSYRLRSMKSAVTLLPEAQEQRRGMPLLGMSRSLRTGLPSKTFAAA